MSISACVSAIERLGAHRLFALAKAAGEHQPQGGVVLLAGFDAFFLGEVLGEHPAAVAVGAGAVHGADGLRERLDMVEILPGIGAQRVERQAALGPRLVEGMLEHGALRRPWRRLPLKRVMLASLLLVPRRDNGDAQVGK